MGQINNIVIDVDPEVDFANIRMEFYYFSLYIQSCSFSTEAAGGKTIMSIIWFKVRLSTKQAVTQIVRSGLIIPRACELVNLARSCDALLTQKISNLNGVAALDYTWRGKFPRQVPVFKVEGSNQKKILNCDYLKSWEPETGFLGILEREY
jgi:hypothetical protein